MLVCSWSGLIGINADSVWQMQPSGNVKASADTTTTTTTTTITAMTRTGTCSSPTLRVSLTLQLWSDDYITGIKLFKT